MECLDDLVTLPPAEVTLHQPAISQAACKGTKEEVHDSGEPGFVVYSNGLYPTTLPNPAGWFDGGDELVWDYTCTVSSMELGATGSGGYARRVSMQFISASTGQWTEVGYACEDTGSTTVSNNPETCTASCEYDGITFNGCSVKLKVLADSPIVVGGASGTGDAYPSRQSICIAAGMSAVNQLQKNYREVPVAGPVLDDAGGTDYDYLDEDVCAEQPVTLLTPEAFLADLPQVLGIPANAPVGPGTPSSAVLETVLFRPDGSSVRQIQRFPIDQSCCGPYDDPLQVIDGLVADDLPIPGGPSDPTGTGRCAVVDEDCADIQCVTVFGYPTPTPVACVGGLGFAFTYSPDPIVISATILGWTAGPFEIGVEVAVAGAAGGSASLIGAATTTLDAAAVVTDMRDGTVPASDVPTTMACHSFLWELYSTCGVQGANVFEADLSGDINKYCAKATAEGRIVTAIGAVTSTVPVASKTCSNAEAIAEGVFRSVGLDEIDSMAPRGAPEAPERADGLPDLLTTFRNTGAIEADRWYQARLSDLGAQALGAVRGDLRAQLMERVDAHTAAWHVEDPVVGAVHENLVQDVSAIAADFDPVVKIRWDP